MKTPFMRTVGHEVDSRTHRPFFESVLCRSFACLPRAIVLAHLDVS